MKLLLTSAGVANQKIIDALAELVGKPFGQTRAVFVTTAANVETGDKWWLVEDMRQFFELGWKEFEMTDIALGKTIWEPKIKNAEVVIVGGGNTSYLMKVMNEMEIGVWVKDKVYVGSSAGSCVTAKNFANSQSGTLYGERADYCKGDEGLGWVEFVVWPHFGSDHFKKLTRENLEKVAKKIKKPMYAISDGRAIKVVDDKIEVVGEGEWVKFN